MTDFSRVDLFDVFIGRQNIEGIRLNDDNISFDVYTSDTALEIKNERVRCFVGLAEIIGNGVLR